MSQVKEEDTATQGKDRQELIAALQETQDRAGTLSAEHILGLATDFGLPVSEVYGVATFYSFLGTRPKGRHVIRVCRSLPCHLKSSAAVIDSIKEELGIKPGEVTADGRFSFELANCIGACDNAPAMMVDHDVHGGLDAAKITSILKSYD